MVLKNVIRSGLIGLSVIVATAAPLEAQAVGSRATPITVTALDGTAVTLDAKAAGRPMLLEFWATWCEVCAALMPTMRDAHARYGQAVDFVGVNVTVNESKRRVRAWVTREKPPYQVIYDESGAAVRAYHAPATSYVVIVDSTGIIRYTGSGSDQDLSAALAQVVAP